MVGVGDLYPTHPKPVSHYLFILFPQEKQVKYDHTPRQLFPRSPKNSKNAKSIKTVPWPKIIFDIFYPAWVPLRWRRVCKSWMFCTALAIVTLPDVPGLAPHDFTLPKKYSIESSIVRAGSNTMSFGHAWHRNTRCEHIALQRNKLETCTEKKSKKAKKKHKETHLKYPKITPKKYAGWIWRAWCWCKLAWEVAPNASPLRVHPKLLSRGPWSSSIRSIRSSTVSWQRMQTWPFHIASLYDTLCCINLAQLVVR